MADFFAAMDEVKASLPKKGNNVLTCLDITNESPILVTAGYDHTIR